MLEDICMWGSHVSTTLCECLCLLGFFVCLFICFGFFVGEMFILIAHVLDFCENDAHAMLTLQHTVACLLSTSSYIVQSLMQFSCNKLYFHDQCIFAELRYISADFQLVCSKVGWYCY